jgi:osmoprotectant transport system ATP-binding protein
VTQIGPPVRIVLHADDVVKRYGLTTALDHVSLEVHAGECVALIGESGSGKSTLLRCFNRILEPDVGRVTIDGADARSIDSVTLRRRIGYVPQDGGLLPHWTVRRNVELVPWLRGLTDSQQLAREALSLVGLDPTRFGDRWPRELSGGQRQRAAFARAIAAHPDVLLLDEPFGALDAITRGDLQIMFAELRSRLGLTTILVTHDLREALSLANRIGVMQGGRIEQTATPRELLDSPSTPYVAALVARAMARPEVPA